jgi:putative membrane protein
MSNTQGDLASLSRFIFTAPSWYSSIAFALFIAALAGVAAFDSRFVLEDAWEGVFYIGVPTVVASLLTPPVDRYFGGQLTPNRASLLALTCELVVVVVLTAAGAVAVLTPLGQGFVFDALVAALASIFALRLLVVMAVSHESLRAAIVPASIQTVAAAVLLFVYSGSIRLFEAGGPLTDVFLNRADRAPAEITVVGPETFGLLAITCVLYVGSVYLFLLVIDRPWRNSLGVSVLDFLRGFVGHIAEGTDELETFFEQLGEEAVVPVTVLSFRAPGGAEKARFVLPMIHPGPMGEIGGGNLPERVAQEADGLAFPPHATAGHDFNLVTAREVETIMDAADRAHERLAYTGEATRSMRTSEGEATLIGQAFGEDAFMTATYAPAFADDVEYAVGLSARAEARSDGVRDVLLADAHNCNNGLDGEDLGHVTPGSRRSFDMIQAAGALGRDLGAAERHPLELGVAWDRTDWVPADGIGPLGVRVAVTRVDGQRTGYVLVDGNNMEPGLRDRLVDRLTDPAGDLALDDAEILTTDTHVVNTVEAVNQVGTAIDGGELADVVERVTAEALDDLGPVEAGMATERAEVTVFGNDRTETLASHANAMISMGGALAAVFILAVTAISGLIFFLA